MSLTLVSIALIVGAGICYLAFVLYGSKIGSDREEVRKAGRHSVTHFDGERQARKEENGNGSKRD